MSAQSPGNLEPTVPPVALPSRGEALALALVLTAAAITAPSWWGHDTLRSYLGDVISPDYWGSLVLLSLGGVLALPAPHSCGLTLGTLRPHWLRVLGVCVGPVILTACVYPFLPERPFRGASPDMWLLSPLAQDLLFLGVIYKYLEPHFGAYVHPLLPIRWCLPVGGLFFALYHVPNVLYGMSGGYVAFQCLYTWLGYTVVGLSRQWTDSILYATAAHMAGNWVAWATS